MTKQKTPSKEMLVLEEQVAQLTNQWKRALADYQNLEKRVAQDKQQFYLMATTTLITRLLPVIDNLERAKAHLKDPGLEMIYKHLLEVLKDEGLEPMEIVGKPFNPQTMEAVDKTEGEDNMVMREELKGYTIRNLVIRPAKVVVGTKK